MNIVFWILVALVVLALWVVLSFAFKAIGSFMISAKDTVKNNIEDSDKEGKEN